MYSQSGKMGITTLSIKDLYATLSMKGLCVTLSTHNTKSDIQHNNGLPLCRVSLFIYDYAEFQYAESYSECHYAECYSECLYAERLYAECYSECHYAEC